MLENKQNVFDDFAAAAHYLIGQKITAPDHLAISGRSNGGLLVAATITQHPGLCKAAVAGVPLTDMVRYPMLQIARLWIPEYGSPEDPEQFRYLFAYSPYHHVQSGTAYPATLILSAESDTRVDPMHARKFAARLQAATSSGAPILLRIEGKAGHGAGKPMAKIVAQYTDEFSFLFAELGMSSP
jgi:prolyl oligopeptidase